MHAREIWDTGRFQNELGLNFKKINQERSSQPIWVLTFLVKGHKQDKIVPGI